MSTNDLATTMMSYMKASDGKRTVYKKNLALLVIMTSLLPCNHIILQRRFTRVKPLEAKERNFYSTWLSKKYSADKYPDDDQWNDIMNDDKKFDYSTTETVVTEDDDDLNTQIEMEEDETLSHHSEGDDLSFADMYNVQ